MVEKKEDFRFPDMGSDKNEWVLSCCSQFVQMLLFFQNISLALFLGKVFKIMYIFIFNANNIDQVRHDIVKTTFKTKINFYSSNDTTLDEMPGKTEYLCPPAVSTRNTVKHDDVTVYKISML